MANQPIKISDNCWKHTDDDGNVYYLTTSDPDSELHRKDGPAIERVNGAKEWYINGKRHRENGPAVKYSDGYKSWFINGKRHREDGPAIEWADGYKTWYINGTYIDVDSQEEFELYIKNIIFI